MQQEQTPLPRVPRINDLSKAHRYPYRCFNILIRLKRPVIEEVDLHLFWTHLVKGTMQLGWQFPIRHRLVFLI